MIEPVASSGAAFKGSRRGHREAERVAAEVGLIGRAPSFLATLHLARQFARTDLPLLLLGETGTGKELLATFIHRLSRCDGELVDVNCGALPEELADSLLFGHRKGAFTGAHADTPGLMEQADGGTLFLDELGGLGPGTQRKLLRALETGEVRRVGGRKRRVDLRIVGAAQPSLGARIHDGEFRVDLMQRVAGAVIALPSLDERREDIPLIADHYARTRHRCLSDDAKEALIERAWPGNIRELRWTIERAAVLAPDEGITRSVLSEATDLGPRRLIRGREGAPSRGSERSELRALSLRFAGDADAIAEALRVSRSTLYRRLSTHGIELRDYR